MRAPTLRSHATYAEYVAFERGAPARHEFSNGGIYAMAGGTVEHGIIAANVLRALGTALLDRPCVVLGSDVRVRVQAPGVNLAAYPDASVVCGPIARAADDADAVTNPLVLVEVLSESTEAYDRGRKFAQYRRIESLREYVLVAQSEPRVEVYQRTEQGPWTLSEYAPGQRIVFGAVAVEIAVDEIYRNVAFPAGES